MNKPVVISGEASETESEDESSPKIMSQSVQGAVIAGEDSESENENDASIASAVSALNQSQTNFEPKRTDENKYDSLLHQKLKEYNARLHNSIDSFCQNTINEAERNLNIIDQQLLRSQLTLQSAATSLKSLSVNSLTVKSKLHSLLSAKFLSNVKVDK